MDKIIRSTAGSGFIKMAFVNAKDTVQKACSIHGCSPTAAAALGRTLCAASIMGDMMKEDNATLTIRIIGGGPLGSIAAVSDSSGCVRGYVQNPSVDLPLRSDGKLDVGTAVGRDGLITVSRDIGLKEPYIGSTELVSGEIAEDVTSYLLESEQTASACALGVLVDRDMSIKAAGGFIVQLMPGAPEDIIKKLEDNIFLMDQLTTILSEDSDAEVMEQVLKGLEHHVVSESGICYRCYCSRERVEQALECIDVSELKEMIDEGQPVELRCQFCDALYRFNTEDLQEILERHKNK